LTSWIPGTLLRYFLNDFEMVPVAPIITGITFVLIVHYHHHHHHHHHHCCIRSETLPLCSKQAHNFCIILSFSVYEVKALLQTLADSRTVVFFRMIIPSQNTTTRSPWHSVAVPSVGLSLLKYISD
jgi:hypothetical protein